MSGGQPIGEGELERLQHQSFRYFLYETNPDNGLVIDKTAPDWPSIAATGFALAAYPVAVERGFMPRATAVKRTLTTLRFSPNSPQGPEPDATGYQMKSAPSPTRSIAARIGNGRKTVAQRLRIAGSPRADLSNTVGQVRRGDAAVYPGALGSPAHPLPESCYAAWVSTYQWEHCYGYEYLYAGPLFTHQLSHLWIDFRGIQDAFMRVKGIDYFENSRRATYVQQEYAIDNPLKFASYGRYCWGITASDGPAPTQSN